MNILKCLSLATAIAVSFCGPVAAQSSLDDLLSKVQQERRGDSEANAARLTAFKQKLSDQKTLLAQAKADLEAENARAKSLETQFGDNEIRLGELEDLLAKRLGEFGELFGVVRQVAGDTRGHLSQSMISAQIPGRTEFLTQLAERKELPHIEELEQLWYLLQQEMTEQGKVVKFTTQITEPGGAEVNAQVIRIGPFTAISDGLYLRYLPAVEKLAVLPRQPGARVMDAAASLTSARGGGATSGFSRAAIDPSRGAILGLLVQSPSIEERIEMGGIVGYIIIGLGAAGIAFALLRILILSITYIAVKMQARKPDTPRKHNPLGRIMMAYERNKSVDVETLELKLDDAILKEIPRLEAGLTTIKVLAAIAPMMGLLGTVTGMIETFQAITLFGTGDPKLMAGGISMALITTVMGLVAAIPLLLLHSFAAGRSKAVIDTIEEQSAGMIAQRAEAGA